MKKYLNSIYTNLCPFLRIFFSLYFGWILLFVVAKIVFMLSYPSLYSGRSFADYLAVLFHGLRLDLATSGYLTALPALFLIAAPWIRRKRAITLPIKIYLGMIVPVVVLILLIDTGLYGYWDFKLDITPLYYFVTAPGAALASASTLMIVGGVIAWLLLSAGIWWLLTRLAGLRVATLSTVRRTTSSAVMLFLAALLFIPIRGGFGVSTLNLSAAYFSDDMRLNHAAINPTFSLMYSAMHQQSFGEMFRFLPPDRAAVIMARNLDRDFSAQADTLLTTGRPDIYIILLESFSAHILPSLGGEPIATRLDSIAADGGLMFSQAYATSFRTDRAIPAVLNAFPSQPTTSLMKFPEKTRHVPSLASTLAAEGYRTHYYYGGDASFANKKTYLFNTGFRDVVTQNDFPSSYRRAKWGVPDDRLFERALSDISARNDTIPRLTIIQTLSSHEPFDVPYSDPVYADNPAANAFRYTDECLGNFIDSLRNTPAWNNAIVIMTADHYGCYPRIADPLDVVARHHIPLIMTGGALARKGVIDIPASQVDIVATLLDGMGIDRSGYPFSHNLLAPSSPHFAYCSTPTYVALVDSTGVASLYNIESSSFVNSSGDTPADSLLQSYVQTLYDTLQSL